MNGPLTRRIAHRYQPTRAGVCDVCGRAVRAPSHIVGSTSTADGTPEWLRRGQTGENRGKDLTR